MPIPALTNPIMMLLLSPLVGVALSRLFRDYLSIRPGHRYGLIFGCFAVALWAMLYSSHPLAISLLFGWILLLLAWIDIAILRLPDILTLPLIVFGLGVSLLLRRQPAEHALACCGGYLLFWSIDALYKQLRGRSGLGLGDAKLFAAAGAWLGWRPLGLVLVLACVGGLIWVAVRRLRYGRASLGAPLPFGAPLCAAIWLTWCPLPI